MSDSVAADLLQSLVRRIESVEDEITALNSDKSEIYKEAKSAGFDVKVMRKLIADRRKDASERAEFETIYELYADALGMYRSAGERLVRAHVEIIEEFPPVASDQHVEANTEVGLAGPAGARDDEAANTKPAHESEAQKVERRSPKPEDAGSIPATLANNAGSSNGRTADFDSANAGSTPAPASKFDARSLRPHCKQPFACGGSGRQHCYKCRVAAGLEAA